MSLIMIFPLVHLVAVVVGRLKGRWDRHIDPSDIAARARVGGVMGGGSHHGGHALKRCTVLFCTYHLASLVRDINNQERGLARSSRYCIDQRRGILRRGAPPFGRHSGNKVRYE